MQRISQLVKEAFNLKKDPSCFFAGDGTPVTSLETLISVGGGLQLLNGYKEPGQIIYCQSSQLFRQEYVENTDQTFEKQNIPFIRINLERLFLNQCRIGNFMHINPIRSESTITVVTTSEDEQKNLMMDEKIRNYRFAADK